MADTGFRLGIDFGTSNTVAVLRWPDGRTKPLLFDGSPLLPSAVYVNADGTILTGRDAVHSARLQPHRFEPYPKRRVEEGTVWLGEQDVPVIDLVATVLRRVAAESYRVAGTHPAEVNLTHPATWPPQRRQTLAQAATAAGFPQPFLSSEPVAAASYFVGTVGTHVPVGGIAVVYDFGAGTFDASVVRRNAGGGFDVLASEGLPDAGGLDVDAAVVAYLGRNFTGREGDQWRRLTNPESEADRRAAWQLWEDARLAKEMLSRAATTYVHVPLFDESVPIGREQLEQLAKPILDRTVTATQLAVTSAGVAGQPLAAVFLVGGSSRIPLAATLLHRAFGLAPTAIEQPELVVAEGALHLAPPTGRAPVAGVPAGGPAGSPTSGASGPFGPVPTSGVPASGGPSSGGPSSGGPAGGGHEPSGDVSAQPVSAQPVSPGFSVPSMNPGLPPLLQTGSMPVVPGGQQPPQQVYQQPAPRPGVPTHGQGVPQQRPGVPQVPPQGVPPQGMPQQGVPQGQRPPVQPQVQQRPPVVPPVAAQPVQQGFPQPVPPQPHQPVPQQAAQPFPPQAQPFPPQQPVPPQPQPQPPVQPAPPVPQQQPQPVQQGFPQQFPPVAVPRPQVSAPPSSGPPVSGPPAGPGQGWPSGGQGFPPGTPRRRRTGTLVTAVGGGVLALILVVAGVVWAVNRDGGGGTPGGDGSSGPSYQAGPAVSAACGHKIAFLGILAGTGSKDSNGMRNATKLAVDDYNAKHPGCNVGFAEFDTKGTEAGSKTAAEDLVADSEVMGVVGPAYRTEILAAAPVLEKAGIPFLTPFAPDVDLAGKGWSTFHRLIANDKDQAEAGGRYLKNKLRASKVVVVYDDSDVGGVARQAVTSTLGGAVAASVAIRRKDTEFAGPVGQVTNANPDAVYYAGESDDGTTFIKALRTAKPGLPVVVTDRLFTQLFVDTLAKTADGIVVTCPCIPSDQAGGDYASRYQAVYKANAGYYGPEAYDGANILLAGFTAGKGTRADLLAFVHKYEGKGVARAYKFAANGDLSVPEPLIWSYKITSPYTSPESVIAP
ncbi:ABC transporter substrate-binding protein [Dactylosporangium aurantiacum]|uniref:ABC transporter substrate-binding protein n=1 Tax=Dactylosporangium aurantiacum TaxID=35754 RepID=A0A9Q9IHH2_9ACTN|nr:ABC transporter substrate-binding protein [Dactylosporangium aurantiacum]MDG6104570.1 ABC transporter substrate-binding protein [Dactylosporangium aurantiacum]UWZ56177.1 ABC transporter substrate-binding protein [Dactylosporangium aurantiacum]